MITQTLNGVWQYRVGKGEYKEKQVPYSTLAVGLSQCKRFFDLQRTSEKIFLRFDRITYKASVTLNGKIVGEMGPYCEYTFDVTDFVMEKNNELIVDVEDISPIFGPTAGWENFGGICGDVTLLYSSALYIENVFFHTQLLNGYKDANYTLDITFGNKKCGTYCVKLSKDNKVVDEYTAKTTDTSIVRSVKNVDLWSPENPALYRLSVTLFSENKEVDSYECNVGFREFTCSRHRFQLNGKDIFLQGVCKHEMQEDYGHCVPIEKVEKEFERIKKTGCNFVRLVHYPHDKKVLDLADRLGIMVSEEPGLWWANTADPEVYKGSMETLARIVTRDRNHPSIVFWLCFNECRFTEKFLIDAVKTCKKYDSTRLVSGANCMSLEDTIKYYNLCGFDFYTMHPYHPNFSLAQKCAQTLVDKPLMFTEWGGYFVYDNPHLLTDFIKSMYALYLQNNDEGALAGNTFWYWGEVNDFTRGGEACVDGMLKEGLVDSNGNPTLIFDAFVKAWKDVKKINKYEDLYEFFRVGEEINKTPFTCAVENDFECIKKENFLSLERFYERERTRNTVIGPALQKEEVCGMYKTPFVVYNNKSVTFVGCEKGETLTILGATSFLGGYPVTGEYGEDGATITVHYEDGSKDGFTMQNGVHFTTAVTSLASSRIVPIAEKTQAFARFSYDKNFENYIINRLDFKVNPTKRVKKVEFTSANNGYNILIYGVFL